ncbi:MAG TPA: cytochrome c3 family protein [Steroidobacteraceae bacterium]|nr:cytochrome c3 family protein [Steroidobacteraceae bacterium]
MRIATPLLRLTLPLIVAAVLAPLARAADPRTPFDHLTTGFELTGQHRDLPCESCHANAVFRGTPTDCGSCHGVGTQIRATAKPANHILSTDQCDACHTAIAFKPAVNFDHSQARGSCSSCHNGVQAQGKGPTHIDTNLECDACHSTIGWAGAIFSHEGITSGCAACHNGVQATGMPATHIPTSGAACELCHSTSNFTSFSGTTMNHAAVSGVPCASCHEAGMSFFGVKIVTRPPAPHPTTGDCGTCHLSTTSFTAGALQPANHIPTTQTCTLCHSNPADFSIYVMSHQGISSGCASCHAAGLAFANIAPPLLKEMPSNHVPTSRPCETCHSATNFTSFAGTSMNHAGISSGCPACHAAGLSFVAPVVTEPAGHIPVGTVDCVSCHSATNFATFAGTAMNHAQFTTNCIACHGAGLTFMGTPPVVTIPANHIPTGAIACEGCHSTSNFTSFAGTAMNHAVVTLIACSTCHEAGKAFVGSPPIVTRPPLPHVQAEECSDCHSTITFANATNYPSNHIPLPNAASANCAQCHSSAPNYAPYTMDHSVVTGTPCATCHGASASFANMAPPTLKVLPATHIPVGTLTCESCHSASNFSTFSGTAMNHAAVAGVACASCHGAGKSFYGSPAVVTEPATHIPIGSTACESCHSKTNFTSFSGTAMNHSGFTTNCIACHGSGLSFVGAPPVVTFPANHIPTGTIACEGCHSTSTFTTFSGTAMNHSVATSIPCSSCHEAGKSFVGSPPIVTRPPPPHVTGGECSVCHFSTTSFLGASNLPPNHIPLPAADGSNCALCHSNQNDFSVYAMNHINVTSNCAQCHAAGSSFANIAPPALKVLPAGHIPVGTTACESCHAATNFATFAGTAMNHAAFKTNCIACHGAGLTFTGSPAVKTFPSNHIPTGTIACEGCHSTSNFTSFAGTAMNHAVVSAIACASCHATGLSFVGSPAVVTEPANHIPIGSTACTSCHSSSNFSTFSGTAMNHAGFSTNCITCHGAGLTFAGLPAVKTFPSNHIPTGTIACESCHSTSNFSTFSGTAMNHTVVTSIACSTCHEAGKSFVGSPAIVTRPPSPHVATGECSNCHFSTTTFSGATSMPPNHIPVPAADGTNCSLCHTNASDYSVFKMSHANITSNCAQCHGAGLSFANIAPPTLKEPPTGPPAHIPTGSIACEQCHSVTNFTSFAGTIMKHAAVRAQACDSCHERGMAWYGEPNLWVRPEASHHKGLDCGGSGCHTSRDKRALRPTAVVKPTAKASATQTTSAAPTARTSQSAVRVIATSADGPAGRAAGASLASAAGPFDHRQLAGAACSSCHNDARGNGRPAGHIPTSTACEACHTTLAWLPVRAVDHTQVKGSCSACHNGALATGKPSSHIASGTACESCHTTNAWTPARVDHRALTAPSCTSCHDAVHAIGTPRNHVPTTQQCSACHGTLAWRPARLDHSALTTNCARCHNGTIATGLSPSHLSTPRDCATCHSYPDWRQVSFRHTSAAYPGEHRGPLECAACHTSNTEQVPYSSPANAGTCAGCHAKDFRSDAHPKTIAGLTYTATELANCGGACHVYSDPTHGVIAKRKPGPYHRISDAAFKH